MGLFVESIPVMVKPLFIHMFYQITKSSIKHLCYYGTWLYIYKCIINFSSLTNHFVRLFDAVRNSPVMFLRTSAFSRANNCEVISSHIRNVPGRSKSWEQNCTQNCFSNCLKNFGRRNTLGEYAICTKLSWRFNTANPFNQQAPPFGPPHEISNNLTFWQV